MPTVLQFRNVRIAIYSNDHPPPHVHAIRPDGAMAKFALNCPRGPVNLIDQAGFRRSEIVAIGSAVAKELAEICAKWSLIHG
jgi:hypothetical protein